MMVRMALLAFLALIGGCTAMPAQRELDSGSAVLARPGFATATDARAAFDVAREPVDPRMRRRPLRHGRPGYMVQEQVSLRLFQPGHYYYVVAGCVARGQTSGFGIGRGYYDQKGNWHGVYAMGFQDSHFKAEWVVGYGWKTHWQVLGDLNVGLGYTAGITTRSAVCILVAPMA